MKDTEYIQLFLVGFYLGFAFKLGEWAGNEWIYRYGDRVL